jgi:hypothetical protein
MLRSSTTAEIIDNSHEFMFDRLVAAFALPRLQDA